MDRICAWHMLRQGSFLPTTPVMKSSFEQMVSNFTHDAVEIPLICSVLSGYENLIIVGVQVCWFSLSCNSLGSVFGTSTKLPKLDLTAYYMYASLLGQVVKLLVTLVCKWGIPIIINIANLHVVGHSAKSLTYLTCYYLLCMYTDYFLHSVPFVLQFKDMSRTRQVSCININNNNI